MHYWGILKTSFVNGDGCRTVIFLSGCNHNCEGCHNPESHNMRYGDTFTSNTMKELFESLDRPQIDGLTLSGGDPMFPKSRPAVRAICKAFRKRYGNSKTIWMYTGYATEELKGEPCLDLVDVVVDGRYIKDLPPTIYRGSNNQRIWRKKEGVWRADEN